MKRPSAPRKTAALPESIHHRLNMYAIAAGAAGVSVLALSQPTEARIIYTSAHVTIGVGQSYKLDLNHDGIADFTLLNTKRTSSSTAFYSLFERPAKGNAVEARYSHNGFTRLAKALSRGARIQSGRAFNHKSALMASVFYGPAGTVSSGSWLNVSGRYLGLRFRVNWADPLRVGPFECQSQVREETRDRDLDWLRLRDNPEQIHHCGRDQGTRRQ